MFSHAPVPRPSTLDSSSRLRAITTSRGYNYLVSQPQGAAGDPSRRWPLIIFLHGAAERGDDVRDVARQGLPRLLSGSPELSAAECEIAREIAERFGVTENTVKTHTTRVFDKLGAQRRTQAVQRAKEARLIP